MWVPLQRAAVLALAASTAAAAPLSPEQIFDRLSKSVFVVHTFDKDTKGIALGSAVVIAPGQVITACHVLRKAQKVVISRGNAMFGAEAQYLDPERDLCQLKVRDLEAPPVTLGQTAKLRVGQKVYTIGSPMGLELTLGEGIVSSLRGEEGSPRVIQTSAPISPGSSGGGLFDTEGRLIGVTTFQFKGQQLNFALPAEWIREMPQRHEITLAKAKEAMDAKAKEAAAAPALAAVAPPTAAGYPRQLSEREVAAQFGVYHEYDARVAKNSSFRFYVNPDGSMGRSCPECKVRNAIGRIRLRASEGVVCIRWRTAHYPDNGCYRAVQVGDKSYELRGLNEEQTIAYTRAR